MALWCLRFHAISTTAGHAHTFHNIYMLRIYCGTFGWILDSLTTVGKRSMLSFLNDRLGCTQGNLQQWKKKEGDEIAAGDSLAVIETDKAAMDWESQDDGFLAKILKPAGSENVKVGTLVCEPQERNMPSSHYLVS